MGTWVHKMSKWMPKCYFMAKHSKYRRYTCIKLRHSRLWEFHTSLRSIIILQVFNFIKVRLRAIGIVRQSCFPIPTSIYHDFVLTNWWWTTACIHSERQLASQTCGKGKYSAHAGHNFKWYLESTQRKSCFHTDPPTSTRDGESFLVTPRLCLNHWKVIFPRNRNGVEA